MSEETSGPPEDDEPDDLGLRNLLQADPRWTTRYEGWQVIGRGAFATVVKTHGKDLGADIAVKILKNLDQEDRRRFQQEIRNAQTLDSPGVVRMYSPFWGSPPWIEMEWVDGPNLKQELQRRAAANDPFPILEGLDIAIGIADVLHEAHDKKIVHRDVKPANILLPRSRRPLVKLADFGIARGEGAGRLTHTGTFPGTPQFGSPESFIGDAPLTAAHDVYSLGLCLYLIFTNNRFPWKVAPDAGMRTWMRLHVHVAPGSARRHVPALDRDLDDLVLRCLRKKPEKRPSTLNVLERLREIRTRIAAEPAVPARDSAYGRLEKHTHALIAAGMGILLTLAALATRFGGSADRVPSVAQTLSGTPISTLTGERTTLGASPPSAGAVGRGAAGEPRPDPASAVSPAIQPEVPAPAITVRGSAVQLRNGPGSISGVRLQVETESQTLHACRIASPLGPGEETFCAFGDFDPEVPASAKLVRAEIMFKSAAGTQTLTRSLR